MSASLSCRALFCYTVAALVAAVGSFHTSNFKFNGNNACGGACAGATSSSASAAAAAAAAVPPRRRGALRAPFAASRRGGLPELKAGSGSSGEEEFYTPADLEAYSKPWGISLHYRSTLNTYRIEAHRPNGEVAGYTTGFYLGDLLHLDKVQVCAFLCREHDAAWYMCINHERLCHSDAFGCCCQTT